MTNIAVIGMGAVTSKGIGLQVLSTAEAQKNNKKEFLRLENFSAQDFLQFKGLRFLTRGTQFALIAAQEALADKSIQEDTLGVVLGTNYAGLEVIANYDSIVINEGPSEVSVLDSPNTLANVIASQVGIKFQAKAFNATISTSSCASLDAIGYAIEGLQQNRAEAVLAGGVDEINPHVGIFFDEPNETSIGEGAGVLLLKKVAEQHSYPLIKSWSSTCAKPEKIQQSLLFVLNDSLMRANIKAEECCLISICAPNHEMAKVSSCVDQFFSEYTPRKMPYLFNLRPALGNTSGADGALHLIAAFEAYRHKVIPATKQGYFPDSLSMNVCHKPTEAEISGHLLTIECSELGMVSAVVSSGGGVA